MGSQVRRSVSVTVEYGGFQLKGNAMKSKHKSLLSAVSVFAIGLAAILPCGCCADRYRDYDPVSRGAAVGSCFAWGMAYALLGAGAGSLVGNQSDQACEGAAIGAASAVAVFSLANLFDQQDQHNRQGKSSQINNRVNTRANHNPIAAFRGDTSKDIVELSASPGETVELSAAGSTDPDGERVYYRWHQNRELGSFRQPISITGKRSRDASFIAPSVSAPRTIHLLLTVSDDGHPILYSHRRIIVTVEPK